MRTSVFAVMVLWVAFLGLAVPELSSGADADVQETNKKEAVDGQGNPAQADQKKATGEKPTKIVKDKPASAPASPVEKKTKPSAEEDRPWLIRERTAKKSDTPEKKPPTLSWKSDEQRSHCQTQLKNLQKILDKTRTYSIRGDNCATTRNANSFLTLADRLKNECPKGFLESNGYSEKIIQNVKVLSELGKKACLEK